MNKADQFLWMVQTAILANGINLSSQRDMAEKYRHDYSALGVLGLCSDALRASEMIPGDLSAVHAAAQFCEYMLSHIREMAEEGGKPLEVPYWFARG